MTDLKTVAEICRTLAFYADRLDRLRGDGRVDTTPPEAAYLSSGNGYGAFEPWYRVIEPIYEELDHYIRRAGEQDCAALFEDPWILANERKLHRIRACYEFDKEFDQARAVLAAPDPAASLAGMISDQVFWTLTPEIRETLDGATRVAVAGSGPLPLTALAVASTLGLPVTSIERDYAANQIARRLIALSGHAGLIDMIEGGIEEAGALDGCDAVVGAVLLGVGVDDGAMVSKSEIVARVIAAAGAGASMALRDPYGLGRLYYPAADLDRLPGLDIERFDPKTGPDLPYRSSLILIRAAQPDFDHARSSAAAIRP